MESLAGKLGEDARNLIASREDLMKAAADQNKIDIKAIEAREKVISQLTAAESALKAALKVFSGGLEKLRAAQAADIQTADNILAKLKGVGTEWNVVTRKKEARIRHTYAGVTAEGPPILTYPTGPIKSLIKFTEALSLPAIVVGSFDAVKQDGDLYYVEPADHFAFRIAGQLWHGNIGSIYTDDKNPEKIKDCKFARSCLKQGSCDYYHDPLHFCGSRDHRNFIASSWLYSPPTQYKNKPRARKFGSRDHLDLDIVGLHADEITRMRDQAMHDMLCAMLLQHTSS